MAEPETVAYLFASHFANISLKDPAAPGARFRQNLENVGVDFTFQGGESYNVLFSASELKTALFRCHDSSPGPDDIPYAFLRNISHTAFTFLLDFI